MAFVFSEDDARRIRDLLRESPGMVLATVTPGGTPEAARVNFVSDPDYTLYFCTSVGYRKTANLKRHKRVAVVVTLDQVAVQLEGTATPLSRVKALAVLKRLETKYGPFDPYVMNHAAFYKIKPHWVRLVDRLGTQPLFRTSGRGQLA